MQRTAQDWLVLTGLTHHHAAAVGAVVGHQFGPRVLPLPRTGSAADRFDRRRLLFATQAVMGALAFRLQRPEMRGQVWAPGHSARRLPSRWDGTRPPDMPPSTLRSPGRRG